MCQHSSKHPSTGERPDSPPDFSEEFYRSHAQRYSEVAHQFIQSVYIRSSHPALKGDRDLLERLKELVPAGNGLDAGCGAGARDVYDFWRSGYDIYGIDAIDENIQKARELHPEIADRVSVADLRYPLSFPDESFDFVICDAVIQHISPNHVFGVTLPELARVLKHGGVLQLMFKNGHGVTTVYDRDYGVERSFHLYDEQELLAALDSLGLGLVEADAPGRLGGVMYFTDPKPVDHCVFFVRKA
jgi:SAM-dependent methyltransferase